MFREDENNTPCDQMQLSVTHSFLGERFLLSMQGIVSASPALHGN